jgi:hypothetical protein
MSFPNDGKMKRDIKIIISELSENILNSMGVC